MFSDNSMKTQLPSMPTKFQHEWNIASPLSQDTCELLQLVHAFLVLRFPVSLFAAGGACDRNGAAMLPCWVIWGCILEIGWFIRNGMAVVEIVEVVEIWPVLVPRGLVRYWACWIALTAYQSLLNWLIDFVDTAVIVVVVVVCVWHWLVENALLNRYNQWKSKKWPEKCHCPPGLHRVRRRPAQTARKHTSRVMKVRNRIEMFLLDWANNLEPKSTPNFHHSSILGWPQGFDQFPSRSALQTM